MSYSTRKIFSYRQIQAVVSPYLVGKCLMPRRSPCSGYITLFQAQVSSLEAYGERPLVILPHKYSKPGFLIGSRYQQNLNKEEMKILEEYANLIYFELFVLTDHYFCILKPDPSSFVRSLKNKGNLFIVPPRCEDDLYCITALLIIEYEAQQQNNQLAKHPYLITNDRFHDHSSMLKQKAFFRKLYQCHAVQYRLNALPNNKDCIEVQYMPAEFLHQIQVTVCPKLRNHRHDSEMKWTGRVWHFPVKGWPANKRFLIGYPASD